MSRSTRIVVCRFSGFTTPVSEDLLPRRGPRRGTVSNLTDPFRRAPGAVFPHAGKWTGVAGPDGHPRTVTLFLSARGVYRYAYIQAGDGLSADLNCRVDPPPLPELRE